MQVLAVIVLSVSTWTLVEEVDLMDMLGDLATESGRGSLFKAAPISLIAVSAVLVLVSFFGCCGAVKVRYYRSNSNVDSTFSNFRQNTKCEFP